jgi:flagellar basal-body rod modification protein FlgD
MAGLQIDPVTGLQNVTNQPKQPTSQDMGSVDFMKLIIAQMRNQNPLEPQKDSDFMAQMAQFEALNQMKLMAQGMKVLQGVNELSSAAGMIGKTVTGKQVDAVGATRDSVARALFGKTYNQLPTDLRNSVNGDPRVLQASFDAQYAGAEVSGKVEKVVVGPDGIPMLYVGGKVVDMFTVSEVKA